MRILLFLADRAQNIDIIVNPAIQQGKIVLVTDTQTAQLHIKVMAEGLIFKQINMLNNIATNNKNLILTLVFDVDIETSMKRVGSQQDRMEKSGKDFFNRVRNGYLELAKQEPERIKLLIQQNQSKKFKKMLLKL